MPIALEARGLAKSYRAGTAQCTASTLVLRSIDLTVHTGEAIGLLGPRGAGKSTLLLCLAGLLGLDAGSVRWFGNTDVSAAARHVLYHSARTDLMRVGSAESPHLHLVDVPSFAGFAMDLDNWIAHRQLAGDAVIISARYRSAFPPDMSVYAMTHGRLYRADEDRARVAEGFRLRA